MKLINALKLESMGCAAVKKACLKHAEYALRCRQKQTPQAERRFTLACALLEQCAALARKMRQSGLPI